MRNSQEQLILFSAQQDNILPLTSACNVKCVFCSHPQNPQGVKVYSIGHRNLEEIRTTLEFVDPTQKIVIGESVTRIMEGEPFLHPEIRTILRMIRDKFPTTAVQITTNGTLLSDEMLDFLQDLGRIELYISLNSSTPKGRMCLMGDKGDVVCTAITKLKQKGISYQGSIVAMPWIVGWNDMEETVKFLDKYSAESVRIFMPGFTKRAPENLHFTNALAEELVTWVERLRKVYRTPLLMEPAFLTDLRARVTGVIQNSPAQISGLTIGDEIQKIDGIEVFSRVDAFYKLLHGGIQKIDLIRSGQEIKLTINKLPEERSGVVFAYDLNPELYRQVLRGIERRRAKKVLLMVSTLAKPMLKIMLERLHQELTDVEFALVVVQNRFFGGSIIAGGLLVIQDFLDTWRELSDHEYDVIMLPGIFLDPWGYDLSGRSFGLLEDELRVPIEVINI